MNNNKNNINSSNGTVQYDLKSLLCGVDQIINNNWRIIGVKLDMI